MNVTTFLYISVETPSPHLGLAARRGQHAVFFPQLTQKHVSYNCLIPANKNVQLSATVCVGNITCRFCKKWRILHSDPKKIKMQQAYPTIISSSAMICYPASLRQSFYFKYLYKLKEKVLVFKICQRYVLTCKATCLRALRPSRPVRELTVHRTFHHAGHIHLPCLFQTKLKENVKWLAQNSRPVSSVQGKKVKSLRHLKFSLLDSPTEYTDFHIHA